MVVVIIVLFVLCLIGTLRPHWCQCDDGDDVPRRPLSSLIWKGSRVMCSCKNVLLEYGKESWWWEDVINFG